MEANFLMLLVLLITIISCSSPESKKSKKSNTEEAVEAPSPRQQTDLTMNGEIVSFKLNDTLVRTNKTTGGDTDENIGIYTQGSKTLSLEIYGDVPQRPHRGWLKFNIKNFKFEPATYQLSPDHSASFSRYRTIDGAGEEMFTANAHPANKGTNMFITFTKIEKVQGDSGTEYLADGNFSVKLYNQIFSATRPEPPVIVNITEGKFEKIRIVGGLGTTLE